jgi:23S rRNA (adenine2030-N6)-methyltransferase
MNYRHAYHAGNFADVFKHAALALIIEHLKLKPQPFRVIDLHGGRGAYDLAGVEAGRTLEWIDGIGRLLGMDAPPLPVAAAALLDPYLGVVRALNEDGRLSLYPGSPLIAARLLRAGDRLLANELHTEDHAALAALLAREARARVTHLDAAAAVKAFLPPPERRGLVVIDPPFEARDEFDRILAALAEAHRRFAHGVYLVWHPIKAQGPVEAFAAQAARIGFDKALRAELMIRTGTDETRFNGCGLLILNPPWTLQAALGQLGPMLAERLAAEPGAGAFAVADGFARPGDRRRTAAPA